MHCTFSDFADANAADVKKKLARSLTTLVRARETVYKLNIAKKNGKGRGPSVELERATNDLRSSVLAILVELCAVDKSFKITLPRQVQMSGPSCLRFIEGADGGFKEWHRRYPSSNVQLEDFGVVPLIPIAIAVVSAMSAAGVTYLATKSPELAYAEKRAELVEKLLDKGLTPEQTKAMLDTTSAPPPAGGIFDQAGKLVMGALAVYAAITWGPDLIKKFKK